MPSLALGRVKTAFASNFMLKIATSLAGSAAQESGGGGGATCCISFPAMTSTSVLCPLESRCCSFGILLPQSILKCGSTIYIRRSNTDRRLIFLAKIEAAADSMRFKLEGIKGGENRLPGRYLDKKQGYLSTDTQRTPFGHRRHRTGYELFV